MMMINPLILNRMGRFLWIIIIGHDFIRWAPFRQSRSTQKYDKSNQVDIRPEKRTYEASLPKLRVWLRQGWGLCSWRKNTVPTPPPLSSYWWWETIVQLKPHVILDSETQVWPERLPVTMPRLWPSVLLHSSRFTGHEKRMGGQHESTTPGSLAQMYYVRFYVAIGYWRHGNPGFYCRRLSSYACGALWRSVTWHRLFLHSSLRTNASDCYARCQFFPLWKRTVWVQQGVSLEMLTLTAVVDLPNSQW